MESRLRSLVVRAGDRSSTSVAQHLATLEHTLQGDVETHSAGLVTALLQCAEALPLKTHVYATLAGLWNARHPPLGAALVSQLRDRLAHVYRHADQRALRLLLRWTAALSAVGLVGPAAVTALAAPLLECLRDVNAPPRSREWSARVMSGVAPWWLRAAQESSPAEAESAMEILSAFLAGGHVTERPSGLAGVSDASDASDRLAAVAVALPALRSTPSSCAALGKPLWTDFEAQLSSAPSHSIAPLIGNAEVLFVVVSDCSGGISGLLPMCLLFQ